MYVNLSKALFYTKIVLFTHCLFFLCIAIKQIKENQKKR